MAPRKKTTTQTTKTVKKSPPRKTTSLEMVSSETSTTSSKKRISFVPRLSKKLLMRVFGVLILVVLFWGASKYLVVAWVNNKPITRFEYYSELDKKNGSEVRDQLIKERLVREEAKKRGVKVEKSEVDARVKQIEEQQGGAEQLNQRLQMSSLTRADFLKLVEQQVQVEKMFSEGVNVTDEDVNKFIEENKEQMPAAIDDKVKAQVKEEIKQQKINENYTKWLNEAILGKSVVRV